MWLNIDEATERTETHRLDASASLDDALETAWRQLTEGAKRSAAPFHLGVLATRGAEGPSLRTVVLRAVFPDQRTLLCHTDARSGKLNEIGADNHVAWLFYDAKLKVQLRLGGKARIHIDDALAKTQWERTRLSARRCYLATDSPGTPTKTAGGGMPVNLEDRSPTLAESEEGWTNFAVVACHIETVDWLSLSAHGHRRAQYRWDGATWQAAWVAP